MPPLSVASCLAGDSSHRGVTPTGKQDIESPGGGSIAGDSLQSHTQTACLMPLPGISVLW